MDSIIQQDQNESPTMQLYAAIAKQSQYMLKAAQQGDWDELCIAEKQCSKLISELQQAKQKAIQPINAEEKQKYIAYLKKILTYDAEIRHLTEPRLKQLEEFLHAASNVKKLHHSYGAESI